MSNLITFLKTRKGRGLILGLLGIVLIFSVAIDPSVTQPIDGLDNDDATFGIQVFFLIPIIITLLIVGFVPYLATGTKFLDNSIKRGITAPLNVYNKDFLSFVIWGGLFGFALSTFIGVNSLDLFLDTTFVMTPELSEDVVNLLLYPLKNPGPAFILTLLVMPLLGYALFLIYKMVYFGTIFKPEKNLDSASKIQIPQKVGRFSTFVLIVSVFGLITNLHTWVSGNFDNLDDPNKLILMFLPIYAPSMSGVMMVSFVIIRFLHKLVGFEEDSEKK